MSDLIDGAQKIQKGLVVETKSPMQGFRLFKVRIGPRNAARMIAFLVTSNQKIVPLLIRLKKDKIFGMNMAMNNAAVVGQLKKNIDRVLEDIETGNYEEFSLK